MNYEISRMMNSEERKKTVEEYMTDWLVNVKQPCLKASSYDRVEVSLKHQVFPEIGAIYLDLLTSDDIQHMVNKAAAEKSYSTAKKAYNNVSSSLKMAVRKGYIASNPADGVVMPGKNKRNDISSYTAEQIRKIVYEATDTFQNGKYRYRYGWAVLLLLNTGIREGELLYLKWKDVDLLKRHIYIHGNVSQVKSRNKEGYELIEQDTPKTSKSTRYVTLNDNAVMALKKLKANIDDSNRVVANKYGGIVRPRKIYDTMDSILKRAGISGCRDIVHALRHTFATMLIRQGTDIKLVSELLGHSDVATTMGIYYHVIDEQKHSAVQSLDDFY